MNDEADSFVGLPFLEMLRQPQRLHGKSVADLFPGADCSPEQHCHHISHGCTVMSNFLSVAENLSFFSKMFIWNTSKVN